MMKRFSSFALLAAFCGVVLTARGEDRTREQLRQALKDLSEARAERDGFRDKLERSEEKCRQLEARFEKLKRDYEALTGEASGKTRLWKPGSKAARQSISGRVVAVNRKYGYIVIDLNTNTRAVQKVGNREHRVDPQLKEGDELVVCRGDTNGTKPPEFITKIRIRSIDDKCSVADLPAAAADNIRTGDAVICALD